jgi:hypothetical protein
MSTVECQINDIPAISEGAAQPPPLPLKKRLKMWAARRMGYRAVQSVKDLISLILNWSEAHLPGKRGADAASEPLPLDLQPGDLVRVRSLEEIQATLDRWNKLRGCGFMPEMAPYCGTTQRVLKPVRRFVDERDRQAKKARGIVLLEGAICQGTADFGPCDRSCYFFWREEWLEKIS